MRPEVSLTTIGASRTDRHGLYPDCGEGGGEEGEGDVDE